jgi:hypothetical protein
LVTDDEFKSLGSDGWKVVGSVQNPINATDKLLTIYSNDANAIGLSSGEYASRGQLADARSLNIIATYEAIDWRAAC